MQFLFQNPERTPPSICNLQITYPEKKALIHPIIRVCGIIIAIFPFIIPIMASIPAGSVIGFAGGWPLLSGSFRNVPFLYAETRYAFRDAKEEGVNTAEALLRRLAPRTRDRRSRDSARVDGRFGGVFIRTVA